MAGHDFEKRRFVANLAAADEIGIVRSPGAGSIALPRRIAEV